MKRTVVSTGAAAALLGAAAWLVAAGCLNPRPEELPSNDSPGFVDLESDDPGDSVSPGDPDDAPTPTPTAPGTVEPPLTGEDGAAPADAGAPDAGTAAPDARDDAEPPPETGEPPE